MKLIDADSMIRILGLEALQQEGGFFRETYRSDPHCGEKAHSSAIFYLIRSGSFSRWHMLRSDEIWFYHAGAAAEQKLLFADGRREKRILGAQAQKSELFQSFIPAGTWQTTSLSCDSPDAWTLFSTVVSPAFDFSDFVLAPEGFDPL